jgi:CheY-like chemotaxis protein
MMRAPETPLMVGEGPVLIIDDDVTISEAARIALEAEGFRVACTQNGQEALDYLRAHESPSLILLDLMMEGVSGWEFRERQRKEPALARIPVVVFSAAGDVAREARLLGAAGYLTKPIAFGDLVETVRRHCGPRLDSP